MTTYNTIAEAESVIQASGYSRDQQRHLWVRSSDGAACKVMRTPDLKFYVQDA